MWLFLLCKTSCYISQVILAASRINVVIAMADKSLRKKEFPSSLDEYASFFFHQKQNTVEISNYCLLAQNKSWGGFIVWAEKWAKSLRSGLVLEVSKVTVSKTKCSTQRYSHCITVRVVQQAVTNALAEQGAVRCGWLALSYLQ